MPSTLVESFELLLEVEQLGARLEAAASALAERAELADEQAWLALARARFATAEAHAKTCSGLLDRALRLPELDSLKGERGKLLQAAVADQVERLQAAIIVAAGERSPLIEVLFTNLKIPSLRKAMRAELEKFCAELARRLTSTYAKRVLATDRYRNVLPAVQSTRAAIATWRGVFTEGPLEDDAAAVLREELMAAGGVVEFPVRQAKLLAQAALLPTAELLEAANVVTPKIKKRGKEIDPNAHPLLETDPPDPLQPNADERAEIAALHAPT